MLKLRKSFIISADDLVLGVSRHLFRSALVQVHIDVFHWLSARLHGAAMQLFGFRAVRLALRSRPIGKLLHS